MDPNIQPGVGLIRKLPQGYQIPFTSKLPEGDYELTVEAIREGSIHGDVYYTFDVLLEGVNKRGHFSFRYYESSSRFSDLCQHLSDIGFENLEDAIGMVERVKIIHGDTYAFIVERNPLYEESEGV